MTEKVCPLHSGMDQFRTRTEKQMSTNWIEHGEIRTRLEAGGKHFAELDNRVNIMELKAKFGTMLLSGFTSAGTTLLIALALWYLTKGRP